MGGPERAAASGAAGEPATATMFGAGEVAELCEPEV